MQLPLDTTIQPLKDLTLTWSFCRRQSRGLEIGGRRFERRAGGHAGRQACRRLHHGPLVLIVASGLREAGGKCMTDTVRTTCGTTEKGDGLRKN